MIADDTFYDMAERLADDYDYDKHGDIRAITFTPAQFLKYSSELIALAQQVKPLEFVQDDEHDFVATSAFGCFIIKIHMDFYIYNGKPYKTEAEAIEAANADYRKLVLSCLVWGGV